jgi:hypothetical protein
MPIISFTTADILRSKLVDEGWYPAKVTEIQGPVASKAGDSHNFILRYTLGEKSPAPGKIIEEYFNSKAMGRMIPLVAACKGQDASSIIDAGAAFQLDTDEIFGKEFDLKVIREQFEGQWNNKAGGYLPKGKAAGVAVPF